MELGQVFPKCLIIGQWIALGIKPSISILRGLVSGSKPLHEKLGRRKHIVFHMAIAIEHHMTSLARLGMPRIPLIKGPVPITLDYLF